MGGRVTNPIYLNLTENIVDYNIEKIFTVLFIIKKSISVSEKLENRDYLTLKSKNV